MSRLSELVGVELGPTSWLEMPPERIDTFATATDDPQWIHTDPERAADGPFGTTISGRVRGRFRSSRVEEGAGGERAKIEATVECDGVDKPVRVAELVVLTPS